MKVNTIIMEAIHQLTMGIYMLHKLTHGELVNSLFLQWFWKLRAKHMTNYITFSEAALKSAIAKIHLEFPGILPITKILWETWQIPEMSLIGVRS